MEQMIARRATGRRHGAARTRRHGFTHSPGRCYCTDTTAARCAAAAARARNDGSLKAVVSVYVRVVAVRQARRTLENRRAWIQTHSCGFCPDRCSGGDTAACGGRGEIDRRFRRRLDEE